jgi:hypothetical protein
MLIAAVVLFAIAALGGLTMAVFHFRKDRNPPGVLAALHGVVAATALLILLWAVVQTSAGGALAWALGLFVLAALGGFFLVSFHVRARRLPGPVVVIHALVAVVAFVLLLAGIIAA